MKVASGPQPDVEAGLRLPRGCARDFMMSRRVFAPPVWFTRRGRCVAGHATLPLDQSSPRVHTGREAGVYR